MVEIEIRRGGKPKDSTRPNKDSTRPNTKKCINLRIVRGQYFAGFPLVIQGKNIIFGFSSPSYIF